MSIYSDLETAVRDTMIEDADVKESVKKIYIGGEAMKKGPDTVEFFPEKLPAIYVEVGIPSVEPEMTLTDAYTTPVTITTLYKHSDREECRNRIHGIVTLVENLFREQKSSGADLSGHGGIVMPDLKTELSFDHVEGAWSGVAETSFSVHHLVEWGA